MRGMLVLLLVTAALAFSGCAGEENGTTSSRTTGTGTTDGTTTDTVTSGETSTTTTSSTGGGGNSEPTGSISASVPSGAVPLNVTFDLSGSDADGDALSWTLDADADGTVDAQEASPATFPATATYSYAVAGLYNATLTVSDGEAETRYSVLINATGGAGAQSISGSIPSTSFNCLGATSDSGPASAYFPSDFEGENFISFDVDASTLGTTFNATYDLGGGGVYPTSSGGIVFADAADAVIFRGISGGADYPDPNSVEDLVPATAVKGYLMGCFNDPTPVGVVYNAG